MLFTTLAAAALVTALGATAAPSMALPAVNDIYTRSNITKRGCEGESVTYASSCGGINLDLTKAVPYARFVLAKTDGSGGKETALDIKNCQSEGKLGDDSAILQWRTRKNVDSDYLQACQTFILNQLPGPNTSPPFALQVADSGVYWGVQPKTSTGEGKLNIQRLDQMWTPFQSFYIHCETGWDGSVGAPYFGKKCLLKQIYGGANWKCLSFTGRGTTSESEFLNGDVELKPCDRQDVSQVVNVKSVYSEFSGTARNFEYKFAV